MCLSEAVAVTVIFAKTRAKLDPAKFAAIGAMDRPHVFPNAAHAVSMLTLINSRQYCEISRHVYPSTNVTIAIMLRV